MADRDLPGRTLRFARQWQGESTGHTCLIGVAVDKHAPGAQNVAHDVVHNEEGGVAQMAFLRWAAEVCSTVYSAVRLLTSLQHTQAASSILVDEQE